MDTNIIYNIDCVAGMNQMIDEASIDLIIATHESGCRNMVRRRIGYRRKMGLSLENRRRLS